MDAASPFPALFSRFPLPDCPRTEFAPGIGAEPVHPVEEPAADPALALIAPYVDAAFYLASFPDDPVAARDPAAHFHQHGWRQGRDPAPWFDTKHYLAANDDVRGAGIDPLLHYLRNGRAEGRARGRPAARGVGWWMRRCRRGGRGSTRRPGCRRWTRPGWPGRSRWPASGAGWWCRSAMTATSTRP